jgi:uncharacterized protein YjbI with pentapeptide repeats
MSDHRHAIALPLGVLLGIWPAFANEHLNPDQVRAITAAAHGQKIDLAGKDLSGDDLTGLDLSGANLAGADLSNANLHGVKLVDADLTGARLAHANLTFAWFIRTNFTHADLHGATLQTVVTSTGMENTKEQASTFVGADLSYTHTTVHFSFDDMRGASFSHADMTVVMANQSMGLLRTEFTGCALDGADFGEAGLGHVAFRFAKLRHANFRNADLRYADFGGAYLDGAMFTGARTGGADFDGAVLTGVKGLTIAPPQ